MKADETLRVENIDTHSPRRRFGGFLDDSETKRGFVGLLGLVVGSVPTVVSISGGPRVTTGLLVLVTGLGVVPTPSVALVLVNIVSCGWVNLENLGVVANGFADEVDRIGVGVVRLEVTEGAGENPGLGGEGPGPGEKPGSWEVNRDGGAGVNRG